MGILQIKTCHSENKTIYLTKDVSGTTTEKAKISIGVIST